MKKRPLIKRIRREAAYLAIRSCVGFFRILPRWTGCLIASSLGRLIPFLDRKDYRLAVEHLTVAFGTEKDSREIRRLARESFRYLAMNFIDTIRIRAMSDQEVIDVCVPHDMDRVRKALERGHGIIGLTSHAGCWELLGAYLAVTGVPTSAIARRLYDHRLEDLLADTRTSRGILPISRGLNTRDIIRVLKKGYLVGVLIDQDTNVKGEFIDFFGKKAHTATSPALLSLKYDSPIVPILTYRDSKHRHHICIGEPLEIEPSGDREHDIRELTILCSKATEDHIRAHPEQWVWFHKRWKTRPDMEVRDSSRQ